MSNQVTNDERNLGQWPEERDDLGILYKFNQKLLYNYMDKIVKWKFLPESFSRSDCEISSSDALGYLSTEDLYDIPMSMKSSILYRKFECMFIGSESSGNLSASQSQKSFLLVQTLWKLSSKTFIPAGVWLLLTAISKLMLPLLIQKILYILETYPSDEIMTKSFPYVIILFSLLLLNSLASQRHTFLSTQSGIIMRSTIATAIYHWTLRLSPKGRMNLSEGLVTNIVAIDSQKLLEMTQQAHFLWYCPLMVIAISTLLLQTMGISAIVGGLCVFISLPFIERLTRKMAHTQKKRMITADKRVQRIVTIVEGIKPAKLNNFEYILYSHIKKIRAQEVKLVYKELLLIASISSCVIISSLLGPGATFTAYVLVGKQQLTTANSFTTLLLFKELVIPMRQCGILFGKAVQGWQACQRLAQFFTREKISPSEFSNETVDTNDVKLSISNGSFEVTNFGNTSYLSKQIDGEQKPSTSLFKLSDINIQLKKSDFFAVTGQVGCGKSTLVNAILGEVHCSEQTDLVMKGTIGFCSQSPFIINDTIRQNIVFSSHQFNELRYQKVLDACCLSHDLQTIGPLGDLTIVGEKGTLLSGGQQARLSIARCIYSEPDIAIFDDAFSALDAVTKNLMFENLFIKRDVFRHDKSIVFFVGSHSDLLDRADQLVILEKGKPFFLKERGNTCYLNNETNFVSQMFTPSLKAKPMDERQKPEEKVSLQSDKKDQYQKASCFCESNKEEHGMTDWIMWLKWLQKAGGLKFALLMVIIFVSEQMMLLATRWWLVSWTDPSKQKVVMIWRTHEKEHEYLETYVYMTLITFVCIFMRNIFFYHGAAKSAKQMFDVAVTRISRAPMSYFQTVSMGYILNRFTFDVQVLDTNLPQSMIETLSYFVSLITGALLISTLLPWTMVVILPVIFSFWRIVVRYRILAVELRRMDVSSRSKIQTLTSEAYNGATTMRAFGNISYFTELFESSIDSNCSILMNFLALQRWILIRIEFLSSLVILFSLSLLIFTNGKISLDTGSIGLLIFYSYIWPPSLCAFLQSFVETEALVTSVERFNTFSKIPQENETEKDQNYESLDSSWPSRGDVVFNNVVLKYSDEGPPCLDGVSFSITDGQWCAVVGRSGAGKSSLISALSRLNEIESGKICIDGINLKNVALSDVRGRENGVYVVCQHPFLLEGRLRDYLDPGGIFSDNEIINALFCIKLIESLEEGEKFLKDYIHPGGRNYSQGQKQQICLARAVLVQPRILILDEATATIDSKTDEYIQQMLRIKFRKTTVITIAHKLGTILDYDFALVMDDGKVREFGMIHHLLEKENGEFRYLVNEWKKSPTAQTSTRLYNDKPHQC